MPWQEVSIMSSRHEFVLLAQQPGVNIRALCRRFSISSATAYKWRARFAEAGVSGLTERSRTPHCSPRRTSAAVEQVILALRDQHPAWGARKLRARLIALGHLDLPAVSTLQAILQRQQRIDPQAALRHRPWQRFEHAVPNALWQMDFKGHFPLTQGRCHPLTVLDDHSRFNVGLDACADERTLTVQARLSALFRRYGLPERMTMDNGSPWGHDLAPPYTSLTVWLIRLGIRVSHSRPYHPQTQGKDERFHRTLKAELLNGRVFRDLTQAQTGFDAWRTIYNQERPHQALGRAVPLSRYQLSPRTFPETLPAIEYGPDDQVRKVQGQGEISVHNRCFVVGKAFHGYPVALRPTQEANRLNVFFCHQLITQIDLANPS